MTRCKLSTGLLLLIALAVSQAYWSAARADEVGRYQLAQGTYKFINLKGEAFTESVIFKIDTATGKTWTASVIQVCASGPLSCRQISQWSEFEGEVKLPPPGSTGR
ncbi:hypothetical protein [Rhodopseudomonas sp. BR0G17]|uniref:hypothetical protein n=1 Tax=Rhodopseudomonas sp. BR0G17 TaxID=2269368 RepID=UPI0013DFE266|nr:hypothetical protein [Rhodopseudomonas sp. BR0G17]NEW95498.1 hypothetical protein [Rhodopseudomonas sp. BR0G17]